MRLALCNEVLKEMDFERQCAYAAELGYQGLELAPFTLGESPELISSSTRSNVRRAAERAGLRIVGLHWLLVSPPGLSINTRDDPLRERTLNVLLDLVDLCAEVGGSVMVHGSPEQRTVPDGDSPVEAWRRSVELFAAVARRAEAAGVTYCLEALPPAQTNFVNRIDEAVQLVRSVGCPAFKTMLDTRAAWLAEDRPPEDLLEQWLPTGQIGHVHLNTPEGWAPGQGSAGFGPLLETLSRNRYRGWISVEPFEFRPDHRAVAAVAAGYLRGILETLE